MSSPTISQNAANNSVFLENIRDLPSDLIFKLFLESADKKSFLENNPISIKKYIRVFLHGYNYEVDFDKKYGNIFFTSIQGVIQKGILSIFLISDTYNQSDYYTYLNSLGYEQLDAILSYFHDHVGTMTIIDERIHPILEQLRTRKEYLKIGLSLINKE